MTSAELASSWIDAIMAYLRVNWHQSGFAAAFVIAAGFLFWRLGKRGRDGDLDLLNMRLQEPAFPKDMPPETDVSTATNMADEEFADRQTVRRGLEDAPHDGPVLGLRRHPKFDTFRDAIAAMKADMARADAGGRKQTGAAWAD